MPPIAYAGRGTSPGAIKTGGLSGTEKAGDCMGQVFAIAGSGKVDFEDEKGSLEFGNLDGKKILTVKRYRREGHFLYQRLFCLGLWPACAEASASRRPGKPGVGADRRAARE